MKKLELLGQRFFRLLVIKPLESDERGTARWLCQCDCGRQSNVRSYSLTSGKIKSCGCLRSEQAVVQGMTHGLSGSTEYNRWCSMKQRCNDPKTKSYKIYGGRGIKISPQWLNNFDQFLADMGPCPPGMTLERIDNMKGYEPGNCVWASRKTQNSNQRRNIRLTVGDKTMILKDWCRELNLKYPTILRRITVGWTTQDALFKPVKH